MMLKKFFCVFLGASFSMASYSMLQAPHVEAYQAVGIHNAGNGCYLNACLQQLYRSQIKDYILSRPAADRRTKPTIHALQNIFRRMDASKGAPVDIKDYVRLLGHKGESDDSVVIFGEIVDKLERELADPSQPIRSMLNIETTESARCSKCGTVVPVKTKKSISLPLDLAGSLDIAISKFKEEAPFLGMRHCGQREAAYRTRVTSTSNMLMLKLNRLIIDARGGGLKKLNDRMTFPPQLNTQLFSRDLPNQNYDLTGVIMHSGTSEGGHYFSYVKSPEGEWYKLDDSSVKHIKHSDISEQCYGKDLTNPCALFYTKA